MFTYSFTQQGTHLKYIFYSFIPHIIHQEHQNIIIFMDLFKIRNKRMMNDASIQPHCPIIYYDVLEKKLIDLTLMKGSLLAGLHYVTTLYILYK